MYAVTSKLRRPRCAKAVLVTCSAAPQRGIETAAHSFADRARVVFVGGSGGKGLISFESLTNIKKRPMGGNGGRGGDIYIEASQTVRSLDRYTRTMRGRDGGDAKGHGNNGRSAKPIRLMVPVGTLVKEVDRDYMMEGMEEHVSGDGVGGEQPWESEEEEEEEETSRGRGRKRRRVSARAVLPDDGDEVDDGEGEVQEGPVKPRREREAEGVMKATQTGLMFNERMHVLADLNAHGQHILIARGGAPGVGNKGSPLTYAETLHGVNKPHITGYPGETRYIELELKSIADVGLVGLPNAGKSSLLGALSAAKPKVADYPFTTLHPTVGVVHFHDALRLTVADIPGLIEGAHADRGLGHDFLRHVERTRVLAYVIDVSASAACDPVSALRTLQRELQMYDPALPRRPSVIVANKLDLPGAQEGVKALRKASALPVIAVSAQAGKDVNYVAGALRWLLEAQDKQKDEANAAAVNMKLN